MFVPFHSVYSSPHRFKNQITSITSQFPPGVSGVCTAPKRHVRFPPPLPHLITGDFFLSCLCHHHCISGYSQFLVSTEAVISEVVVLPTLKNQHHLGEFSAVTVWSDLILKHSFYLSHLFWDFLYFLILADFFFFISKDYFFPHRQRK